MRKGRPSDKEKNLIYAGSKFNKLASETALKLQMNKSALVRKKLDKPVDEMAVRAERFDKYFDNVKKQELILGKTAENIFEALFYCLQRQHI